MPRSIYPVNTVRRLNVAATSYDVAATSKRPGLLGMYQQSQKSFVCLSIYSNVPMILCADCKDPDLTARMRTDFGLECLKIM